MPSTAVLRSGHATRSARRLAEARNTAEGATDACAVLVRGSSFTDNGKDDDQFGRIEPAGAVLIRGRARLNAPGGAGRVRMAIPCCPVALTADPVPCHRHTH